MEIANVVPKWERSLENLLRHPSDNSLSFVALVLCQDRCYPYCQQTRLHDSQSRHEQPYVTIPDVIVR